MIWQRVSVQAHVPGEKKSKNPETTTKPPSSELQGNSRAGVDV